MAAWVDHNTVASVRALARQSFGDLCFFSEPSGQPFPLKTTAATSNGMLHSNFGERATPEVMDWAYYAHLSIYNFVVPLAKGKSFLDLGCGTGYGPAHIAQSGAERVFAVERDAELVSKLKSIYPAVQFDVCDLDEGRLPWDAQFDVVFSSNVFEHLVNLRGVLSASIEVLAKDGTMIVAVPPIDGISGVRENARNIFHLSNLTIDEWKTLLQSFFGEVKTYQHYDVLYRDEPPNLDRFSFWEGPLTGLTCH